MKRLALLIVLVTLPASACGSDGAVGGGPSSDVVNRLPQCPPGRGGALRRDGEPVTVFSGEGIVLDRPQTRHDYEDLLPVIAVAAPGFDQEVASPVKVSGLANVFEANVSVEVL